MSSIDSKVIPSAQPFFLNVFAHRPPNSMILVGSDGAAPRLSNPALCPSQAVRDYRMIPKSRGRHKCHRKVCPQRRSALCDAARHVWLISNEIGPATAFNISHCPL